ncbi:hypothetical protein ES332_A03G108700v1 [Gossypium tomentosum]|uniref:NAD(P)H-quinone oxidoreductase subunit 5, chloroplastic n=1 Tax=Gossypium tomentosum TaxID=34277 RepID=A0A5D2R850_GOSTO|nr:hypothetical protein ES332_A03G108700v1 [Gossypium tomentosum]
MLGLVTSCNLIQIYIFWELVGMCSYLLIGFWFTRPAAANACQKAFVTNRIGDFVAKSAQFPLNVWLPDAMEGPTPISAVIHAATMVATGIFLVARLLPLFIVIPYIMNLISFIGIIMVLLGATLALSQNDIKRGLAYSTMSQLGYMMLALGMGSYRAALFHLITHAYSKALLFLASGSIIHSMEAIVGYSPEKSQNMVFMGGLKKHVPVTRIAFLVGTLSLCGIPPLACFWSKDEILSDSWLSSPIFAIIAWSNAGLTAFYMFRIYLLTFEGHLNVHFQKYSGKKSSSFYSIKLWGKEEQKIINRNFRLFPLLTLTMNNNEQPYTIGGKKEAQGMHLDIVSKLLTPSINLLHQNSNDFEDSYQFFKNATFSVSIACFGIFTAFLLYKPFYSSAQNLNLLNSFVKRGPKRILLDKMIYLIYDWSYNRGYIDMFYSISLTKGIRGLAELTHFFDRRVIDGITNRVGITSFFVGESVKYLGGSRISFYLLLYLVYVFIFLVISYFILF